MIRAFVAAIFVWCAVLPAAAQSINIAIGIKQNSNIPIGATPWSTLGVVADSTTDNTAALNALPTTGPIFADCPAGGSIRVVSRWFLQTNLKVYGNGLCPMVFEDSFTQNRGTITQSNVDVAITGVVLDGLNFQKTVLGRLFYSYINGFTLNNTLINHKFGFAFIRGANQIISNNVVITGPCTGSGCVQDSEGETYNGPGIRHFGNAAGNGTCPEVAQTSDFPSETWPSGTVARASVWIFGNIISSHDGTYQIDQTTATVWGDNAACYTLFENNRGFGLAGRVLMLAGGTYVTNDIIFRNNGGAATGEFLEIGHGDGAGVGGGGIHNVLVANTTIDASPQTVQYTLSINSNNGPMSNITISGAAVTNPKNGVLVIEQPDAGGSLTGLTVTASTFGLPRQSSFPTVNVRGDVTNFSFTNNTVVNGKGNGINLCSSAGTCTTPTVTGNTISGIRAGDYGISINNVTGGAINNNVITRQGSSATSGGLNFGASVSTTTATGNTLTNLSPAIVCPPAGLGNTITGNAGASACP